MPGALPEILPSPDQNANIDRCWTCRSMFMQAWGHYGTAWPVIHQQLGVRPSLGTGRLEIVPSIPRARRGSRAATSASATTASSTSARSAAAAATRPRSRRRRRRRAQGSARRRDAPGRRGGRHRHARRRPRPAPDGARDQPRRRGHGRRPTRTGARGGGDHGLERVQTPHRRRETGGRHAVEEGGDVRRRDAVRAGDRGSGTGTERERPAAGPAGGDRGHAGVLGRLPGRPLLRQRLAHHRRDGRDLGAAAQARRRRLVRRRRPVGRAGHEVHERARLHALRPAAARAA